ncbi:MAG: ParB/RepB/Spo0J family partition protein [Rhodospirillaceae bacterium]|nr:ParB/RepB/Spo0J family partition protein [Rhodospirillaceae bacterium]
MQLAHIPIENLSISALNMRDSKKAPDISDILPSIRKFGVRQTLLVRPNGTPDHYEVVGGRRRYYGAKTVAAERGVSIAVPCAIMEEDEDAAALESSMIENLHQPVDEMTQYESFVRLIVKEGRSIEDVGATFGYTDKEVRQRLALGNLLPKIREAYRRGDIDPESIRHLTLATKKQQKAWLDLFESEGDEPPAGRYLKDWLFGGESISTKVALFSLDAFSGQITEDLFGENSYFADAGLFWTKQNEAIAARRDAYLEAGWSEVVVLDPGTIFQSWEHEKRKKKDGGRVYVAVSPRGDVTFHEGYVTRKEAQRAAKKAAKKAPDAQDTEKAATVQSEVPGAMQTYIDLHRHAAVRAALLDKPGVALRLLAAHAICGSRLWKVMPEPQRSGRDETDASVKVSPAQAVFDARREDVSAIFDLPKGAGLVGSQADTGAVIFAHLLTLSDADVRRILTVIMAESLEAGSVYVEAVGVHLGVDMTKCWTADETFFDLLRDKSVVNAMVAEIAGKSVANGNVAATGKVQKQIVRDCLAGTNGREKVSGWLPRWFEFPVRSYRKDGGLQTAAHWKFVKKLFGG